MDHHEPDVLKKVLQRLAYADEDLRWAQHGFTLSGGSPYRLIAYHDQQCVEKHLKACIVSEGVYFPYAHNIARLLELCAGHARWAETLKDAEELTPFATSMRCPDQEENVTETEARRCLDIAVRVRQTVRKALVQQGIINS
jgi:HEPN domain-containing protein